MFITWMLITPCFKKSLIVEQFQGNYLKLPTFENETPAETFPKVNTSIYGMTCMIEGNFGNVSAGILFSKVAYQRKRW